jgi:hypothetical protein
MATWAGIALQHPGWAGLLHPERAGILSSPPGPGQQPPAGPALPFRAPAGLLARVGRRLPQPGRPIPAPRPGAPSRPGWAPLRAPPAGPGLSPPAGPGLCSSRPDRLSRPAFPRRQDRHRGDAPRPALPRPVRPKLPWPTPAWPVARRCRQIVRDIGVPASSASSALQASISSTWPAHLSSPSTGWTSPGGIGLTGISTPASFLIIVYRSWDAPGSDRYKL